MMTTIHTIASLASGQVRQGAHVLIKNISIDTRSLQAGALYIALIGENFDGHQFVEEAFKKGAVAAMVNESWAHAHPEFDHLIMVEDTGKSLLHLGKAWAKQWQADRTHQLIVLTGSNGKTSTKEMISSILQQHFGNETVLATTGNFNNMIGLPLTLLNLRPQHRFGVIEAGINTMGEMSLLIKDLQPNIALITNAQRAHLKGFVNVACIAHEKGILYEQLAPDGLAFINSDDPSHTIWVQQLKGHLPKYFSLNACNIKIQNHLQHITTSYHHQTCTFTLPVPGIHQANNAVAAIAVAEALHVSASSVQHALMAFKTPKGRMNVHHLSHMQLIDDTYNANPDSMRAAIDALCQFPAPRILVMGDMNELGSHNIALHREIQEYALAHPIDCIFISGTQQKAAYQQQPSLAAIICASTYESIATNLKTIIEKMTTPPTVLIKGSRLAGLEKLVHLLAPSVLHES